MSYSTQIELSRDRDLMLRVAACAATQGLVKPDQWVVSHAWELSAQPGWDEAYASAIAADLAHPGAQNGVITDAMILAGVQAIVKAETTAN